MSARQVVVTGGGKGIGRAIVERFARAGDEVTAVGRDAAALEEIEATAPNIRTATCDVTDEQAVHALFAALPDVDVLVCNAGAAASASVEQTTLATWRHLLDVNATGVFLCVREVVASMRTRGAGRIVVIASVAGRIGTPYTAAYSAAKHAAVGLTRVVAAELAGSGVSTNAICPTFVDSPMTDRSVANISARTGRNEQESRRALVERAPLGRLLTPAELAEATWWLASSGAGAINGQALVLDGGGLQA